MANGNDKSGLSVKDIHRLKLLEYLANPENELFSRCAWAEKILKIDRSVMYRHFNGDELTAIEGEALNRRRARYGIKLAQVDKALFDKAIGEGDVKAIELIYKKFENWNPNQKIEISTGDSFNETLAELGKRLPE